MATVQRANVILTIADDPATIQRYKDKGFNVIEKKTGKILERAVPHDAESLRERIAELETVIGQKDKEIQKLQKKLKQKSQVNKSDE